MAIICPKNLYILTSRQKYGRVIRIDFVLLPPMQFSILREQQIIRIRTQTPSLMNYPKCVRSPVRRKFVLKYDVLP